MKRVIIVEDETAAQQNLRSMLKAVVPDVEVVEVLESVEEAVDYFAKEVSADIVFMDIHLADGDSFRIFQSVSIDIPIIFTTAYDEYALEAFKVNSVDYLLKPFKEEDLRRALDKLQRLTQSERSEQRAKRDEMVQAAQADTPFDRRCGILLHLRRPGDADHARQSPLPCGQDPRGTQPAAIY